MAGNIKTFDSIPIRDDIKQYIADKDILYGKAFSSYLAKSGQAHSSSIDQAYITVLSGQWFRVKISTSASLNIYLYAINSENVDVKNYGSLAHDVWHYFVAPGDIAKFGIWNGQASQDTTVSFTIELLENYTPYEYKDFVAANFSKNLIGSEVNKLYPVPMLHTGDNIILSSSTGQAVTSNVTVTFYDKHKTALNTYALRTMDAGGVRSITLPSSCDGTCYISKNSSIDIQFEISNTATAYEPYYVTDFVESLDVSGKLDKFCLASRTYNVTSGSAHSSSNDKVYVDIENGVDFYILLVCKVNFATYINPYDNNGHDYGRITANRVYRLKAVNDISSIGIYNSAALYTGEVAIYIFSDISLFTRGFHLDDVSNLNSGQIGRIRLAKQKKNPNYKSSQQYLDEPETLTLVHFSDIHANTTALQRIIEFCNTNVSMIDDIVCTGDMVRDQFSDGMSWWDAVDGSENIITCIGNHEVAVPPNYTTSNYSEEQQYTQYIAPYVDNWNLTSYQVNKTYFYKDYTSSKIRLIVVNCMLYDSESTPANDQNTWLAQVLNDALQRDYAVIVMEHFPPYNSNNAESKIDTNFTAIDVNTTSDRGLSTTVQDNIETFINNGGEFVCYLAGHTHTDYIMQSPIEESGSKKYPNQTFVIVGQAAPDDSSADNERIFGERSYDLFNVVVVDKSAHVFKLIRIGANEDYYLRGRNVLVYDYVNNKIISEL